VRNMTLYKNITGCVLMLACIFFSAQSVAAVKLYYAGIAYMGNYSAKETLYKYSSRLIDEDERKFQKALNVRLKSVENESFSLLIDGQTADYNQDDALTMAFALEYENVSIEKIGDIYKLDIDLRANILVFDYNEMKIISSYPIAIQLRDVAEKQPTDDDLKDIVEQLYLSNKYQINIFDEFVKRLSSLELKNSYANTIQVSKVKISSESKSNIPGIEEPFEEGNYKTFIAQMFSTYLSKNQNVSVLPYITGHAIGKKMAVKLSNGDGFSLEIPDATFAIELELIKLQKAQLGENDYKSIWGYASYFDVKLVIPGVDRTLVNAKFRGLVKKTISNTSAHSVDDWSIYKESIYRLFDDLTVNISEPDNAWLASVTATDGIAGQLEKFDSKIQSCL
jgi:hypothetical protein